MGILQFIIWKNIHISTASIWITFWHMRTEVLWRCGEMCLRLTYLLCSFVWSFRVNAHILWMGDIQFLFFFFFSQPNTTLYVRSIWMCVAQWWWRWLFVFILLLEPNQIEIYSKRWKKEETGMYAICCTLLPIWICLQRIVSTKEKYIYNKCVFATLSSTSMLPVRRTACISCDSSVKLWRVGHTYSCTKCRLCARARAQQTTKKHQANK